MVVEISYEKYKTFCSYLPCKDVFYFIKNLFVKFPNDDTIYGVKYDFKEGPEVSYNNLITPNSIEMISLADFLLGLPVSDAGTYIKDDLYRDKNFLVLL